MTPAAVHYGQARQLHATRARVLDTAYERHPERFVRKPPAPPEVPSAAWINSQPIRRRSLTKFKREASRRA
jgi:putative transposase